MVNNVKLLEAQVASAWKSHTDATKMTATITDTGVHFALEIQDQELGDVHLDIAKGAPLKFAAYRQWGDAKVAINRSFAHVVGLFRPGPDSIAERSVFLFFKKLEGTIPASILQKLPHQAMVAREQKRLLEQVDFDNVIAKVFGESLSESFSVCRLASVHDINQSADVVQFYGAEGEAGIYRRQAATSFPILAELISKFGPIGKLIDAKQSFIEVLGQILTVDGQPSVKSIKTVLSKLSGVSAQFDNNFNNMSPTQFVRLLTTFPPDWIPRKSGAEIDALVALADMAMPIIRTTNEPLSVIMQGAGGKWVDFTSRIVKAQAETRLPEGATQESFAELSALSANIETDVTKLGQSLAIDLFIKNLDEKNRIPEMVRSSVETWLIDSKLVRPDVGRILPTINLAEDLARGYANRVLTPLLMQSSGSAAIGGISNANQQMITNRAGEILFKGKTFPAIVEILKKCRNDINTFMSDNIPDDLTAEEIEAEINRQDQAQRQAEMDRLVALRAMDDAARKREEFQKVLDGLLFNKSQDDANGKLRRFFAVDDPPKKVMWAPFIPILQAPNGIYIVPLITPEQLFDEGGYFEPRRTHVDKNGVPAMNICVGQSDHYAQQCLTAAENIFSFRKLVGNSYERIGCLQVQLRGKNSLSIQQFRGKSNKAVPSEAKVACDWLMQAIATGLVPFNPEPKAWRKDGDRFELVEQNEIPALAGNHRGGGGYEGPQNQAERLRRARVVSIQSAQRVVSANAGYDWDNARILRTVLRTWSPLLPKAHRNLTIDEYKGVKEIRELLEKVFPSTRSTFQIRRAHRP